MFTARRRADPSPWPQGMSPEEVILRLRLVCREVVQNDVNLFGRRSLAYDRGEEIETHR